MQESVVITAMRELGWPLLDVRATEQLRIESRLIDTPVLIEGFGPGLWAEGSPDEGAWYCFVTLTLGEPEGDPTRWAVMKEKDVVAQVIGGDDWAIIASGLMITTQIGLQEWHKVKALLTLAERILPPEGGAKSEASQHVEWPFETLGEPTINRRIWPLKLGGGAMFTSSVVGFIGALAVLGDPALFLFYPALGLGFGGVLAYATGSARRKAIFRAHGQAEVSNQTLKSSPVFNDNNEIRACRQRWFSVVQRREDEHLMGEASMQSALLVARSTENDLTLKLKLHSTHWPDSVLPQCVYLIRSWCTAEIAGPSEQLIRVPARNREQRSAERVRWQMGAEELDRGALVDWLQQVDAAFHGVQTGPYR